jgi:copper(I)-binding protein
MFKKLFATLAILVSAMSLSGCSPDSPEVTTETPNVVKGIIIENATVSVGDTEAIVTADITNRLNGTITMTGAKTSAASETKLFKGDKSLPEGSEIHVGQTLSLNEAGKHFVLLKLTKPIAFGDKIDFTFEFDGADPQTVQLTAK